MPGSTISENLRPVAIKQTNLHKYFEHLSLSGHISELIHHSIEMNHLISKKSYHYTLEADNLIEIEEKHCHNCNSRLILNGYNDRKIIYDKGGGEHHFRLHRKRCPKCGEIGIDLSAIVPPQANYHHNFRRRARQLYAKGLIPPRITEAFSLLTDQWVPKSTVVYWLRSIEKDLHHFLVQTPVPSSGKWGYDEIFLNLCGKKHYALTMVDTITGFAISVEHVESFNRNIGMMFLRQCKRGGKMPIKVIHKDGGMIFGNLFQTRSYQAIKVQYCTVHNKWLANRYAKQLCGMSVQSKKPLPPLGVALQRRLYRCIDASNETEMIIAVMMLKNLALRLENHKLMNSVRRFVSLLENQHHWHTDPDIYRTNNRSENFNQFLQKHPTYKRRMKTLRGTQRVADYLCFQRNLALFTMQKLKDVQKYRQWRSFYRDDPSDMYLIRQGAYYRARKKHLDDQFHAYLKFWEANMKIFR